MSQKAITTRLERLRGMSKEAREAMKAKLDVQGDWVAYLPNGEVITGTPAQLFKRGAEYGNRDTSRTS